MERDSRKTKAIGIRLTPAEKDEVNYICFRNGFDISDMIRKLVYDEYRRLKDTET